MHVGVCVLYAMHARVRHNTCVTKELRYECSHECMKEGIRYVIYVCKTYNVLAIMYICVYVYVCVLHACTKESERVRIPAEARVMVDDAHAVTACRGTCARS